MTSNLSKSVSWREFGIEIDRVDTSPREGVRLPGRRLSARDVARGARIFCEFLSKLPGCGAVLLLGNNRFMLTEGVAILLVSGIARKPVFVKVFGASFGRSMSRLPRLPRKVARKALGTAVRILPETRVLAGEFVDEIGFEPDRVTVLPNFVPDGSFGASLEAKRFSGRCVFFGQIKREKGVFDIIEALGGRPGLSCDFYGPVVGRDRSAFLEEIAGHTNCVYKGAVEPGTVPAVASAYDVLLLPTYHPGEGYPAVILEAYAAGIPVIATNWRSLPEIVTDGAQGILVPVKSPERIREAIERLRSDERLYESMRSKAYAFARSFSESAVVKGILVPLVADALSGAAGRNPEARRVDEEVRQ